MASNYPYDQIERNYKYAQELQASGSIPASVTLAQMIIEGTTGKGGGLSTLAKDFNNFFGIKADNSWTGKSTVQSSPEWRSGKYGAELSAFRAYNSPEESFLDHALFLQNNPRYAKNGVFSTQDPREVAQAIKNAGYATDPNYADDIMYMIKKYDLAKYDVKRDPGKSLPKSASEMVQRTGGTYTPAPSNSDSSGSNSTGTTSSGGVQQAGFSIPKPSDIVGDLLTNDTLKPFFLNISTSAAIVGIVIVILIIILVLLFKSPVGQAAQNLGDHVVYKPFG